MLWAPLRMKTHLKPLEPSEQRQEEQKEEGEEEGYCWWKNLACYSKRKNAETSHDTLWH